MKIPENPQIMLGGENVGRMRKQTADFFPHFAYKGRTLTVLESKWGCEGYTFWFKLLELLCVSEGHCYDCSNPTNMGYLAIMAMTSEETALKILNLLADMGKIDTELWKYGKLIWCQSLVDRLIPLYAKRTATVPEKPTLKQLAKETTTPKEPISNRTPFISEESVLEILRLLADMGKIDAELLKSEETNWCQSLVNSLSLQKTSPEPPEQSSLPQTKPEKKDIKKKEKPPKSTAAKPPEPQKIKYAEFVSMTEAEHQNLIDKYGAERTELFIKKLDNAKGAKGYKYKSDYRAILNWVVGEVERELQKKKGGNANGRPYPDRNDVEPSSTFTPSGGFRGNDT